MYNDFSDFAQDMNRKFDVPVGIALNDINECLTNGYGLDDAVNDLVSAYEKEFADKR